MSLTANLLARKLERAQEELSEKDAFIAELERQLEQSHDDLEEAERGCEQVAEEFEGDVTKAMMRLLNAFDFDWTCDPEGVTPDQAEQFILDIIRDGESSVTIWKTRAEDAERELRAANDRLRHMDTAGAFGGW